MKRTFDENQSNSEKLRFLLKSERQAREFVLKIPDLSESTLYAGLLDYLGKAEEKSLRYMLSLAEAVKLDKEGGLSAAEKKKHDEFIALHHAPFFRSILDYLDGSDSETINNFRDLISRIIQQSRDLTNADRLSALVVDITGEKVERFASKIPDFENNNFYAYLLTELDEKKETIDNWYDFAQLLRANKNSSINNKNAIDRLIASAPLQKFWGIRNGQLFEPLINYLDSKEAIDNLFNVLLFVQQNRYDLVSTKSKNHFSDISSLEPIDKVKARDNLISSDSSKPQEKMDNKKRFSKQEVKFDPSQALKSISDSADTEIGQLETMQWASGFMRLSQASFYELILSYLATADEKAIENLHNFLVQAKLNQDGLKGKIENTSSADKSVPLVTVDDFVSLANLGRDGLNELHKVMKGTKKTKLDTQPLKELFRKLAVIHHAEIKDLKDEVNHVYNKMLGSLDGPSFKYALAYSYVDRGPLFPTRETFSTFEEAKDFWQKTEADLNLKQKDFDTPRGVYVVSLLEDKKITTLKDEKSDEKSESSSIAQEDNGIVLGRSIRHSGFVSSQKIAKLEDTGTKSSYKEVSEPKIANPDSRAADYFKKLERLESRHKELTNNPLRRFLEMFGVTGLTEKKRTFVLDVITELKAEQSALLNGTKSIRELVTSKLGEKVSGEKSGISQSKNLTWGEVIAKSSVFKVKTTKTEKLFDEIIGDDARKGMKLRGN